MSLVIGLTGGIGSGKTAVSDRFAQKGITIVDADVCSRIVVEPGQPALKAIEEHFGADVIQADGSLNRAALREHIFQHPDERKWLESLLHPLIAQEIMRQLSASQSAYTLLVSPLLIESGQHNFAKRVLVVDAPQSAQLERTVVRDNVSAEQVKSIISAQADRDTRLARADDIIINDKDLAHLDAEVDKLHQFYLQLASAQ